MPTDLDKNISASQKFDPPGTWSSLETVFYVPGDSPDGNGLTYGGAIGHKTYIAVYILTPYDR